MIINQPKHEEEGDGCVDLVVEYVEGYQYNAKLQVKTTRFSKGKNINDICWQISDSEIRKNNAFIFVLFLEESNLYLVAGFLVTEQIDKDSPIKNLSESSYDKNKKIVKLENLFHLSGCLEYLDSVFYDWLKHGKHLGHVESPEALDWSMRFNLIEQDYHLVKIKADLFLKKQYKRTNIDPYFALGIAEFKLGKWQDALNAFNPYLSNLINVFETDGDSDVGAYLQHSNIMSAEQPFAPKRLSEGILAILEHIIICCAQLNQLDEIISSLKKGIECIKTSKNEGLYTKSIEYHYNLARMDSNSKNDCKEFLQRQLRKDPDLVVRIQNYMIGKNFGKEICSRLDQLYWDLDK